MRVSDSHCQTPTDAGDATSGDDPAHEQPTGYEDFVPADTLEHDHGIKRNRLSEAATAGLVETKPAQPGLLDSQGRRILKTYNKKQAIKHCSATNTAPK